MEYKYETPMLKYLASDSAQQRNQIDANFGEIRRFVKPGKLFNFCINGLYTVNEKEFLSADKWVWNLQPTDWVMNRFKNVKLGDNLLTCSLSSQEAALLGDWISLGYLDLKYSNAGLELYSVVRDPK
jgi:hypothetical protein